MVTALACPKCGAEHGAEDVACKKCGLAVDRMESFANERDAAAPVEEHSA